MSGIIRDGFAGLWFEFEGSGSCISASAISGNMDVALALYTGECDGLQCIDALTEALTTADVAT